MKILQTCLTSGSHTHNMSCVKRRPRTIDNTSSRITIQACSMFYNTSQYVYMQSTIINGYLEVYAHQNLNKPVYTISMIYQTINQQPYTGTNASRQPVLKNKDGFNQTLLGRADGKQHPQKARLQTRL